MKYSRFRYYDVYHLLQMYHLFALFLRIPYEFLPYVLVILNQYNIYTYIYTYLKIKRTQQTKHRSYPMDTLAVVHRGVETWKTNSCFPYGFNRLWQYFMRYTKEKLNQKVFFSTVIWLYWYANVSRTSTNFISHQLRNTFNMLMVNAFFYLVFFTIIFYKYNTHIKYQINGIVSL